jgi:hypothetical protein
LVGLKYELWHDPHNIKANEPISQQRKNKTIITKQTDKPTTSTSNCNVSSSKLQTDKQNKGYLSIFSKALGVYSV